MTGFLVVPPSVIIYLADGAGYWFCESVYGVTYRRDYVGFNLFDMRFVGVGCLKTM